MSNEELVAVIQSGAPERMGELWEQVAGLVKWKVNRVMGAIGERGVVEFDDLYQSGYLALVSAVETYDPATGAAFSTWFMYRLKTAFAEATGIRSKKQQKDPIHNAASLDKPLTDDVNSDTLVNLIADPGGLKGMVAVEEQEYRKQLHDALEMALEAIPEGYSEVLRLRYYDGLALEDLAKKWGVSRERVHQKENTALRYLRRPKTACHLRPFLTFDFYCGTSLGAFRSSGMTIQEKYLIIEEERKEREEQERKRRDEEWRQRMEESRKSLDEYYAQRAVRREQLLDATAQELTPEGKERLMQRLAELWGT